MGDGGTDLHAGREKSTGGPHTRPTKVCADHDHEPFQETDRTRPVGFKWRCPWERRDTFLRAHYKRLIRQRQEAINATTEG